ncbi:MAG: ribbon-helix-helix domain-containing protein [Candidatus Bipolaricaulia bacterium]
MRRVNWTITEAQHQALKRRARETGLPISELVRRALDKYLNLADETSPDDDSSTDDRESEVPP